LLATLLHIDYSEASITLDIEKHSIEWLPKILYDLNIAQNSG